MSERDEQLDRLLDEHLEALGSASAGVKLRPGMAARALAAAREERENDLLSRILRAARFELPVLAALAASVVILAVRATPATVSATATTQTTAAATNDDIELFPATESTEAWASWAYDSSWDESLWSEVDG